MCQVSHTENPSNESFSEEELAAIECHKYYLSEAAGHDVGDQFAREHWVYHHSKRWRHQRLNEDLTCQMAEMQRYRWLQSEKAGYDLGAAAELEWIRKYAAQWRQRRERERSRILEEPEHGNDPDE